MYSGKQMVSGDFLIFSSNMSFLFRNRMTDVSVNHLLLQILSNSFMLSCMRFWGQDSAVSACPCPPPPHLPSGLSASHHLLVLS